MSNFYKAETISPELYGQIVPAYQEAFRGDPWYEVSKCPDRLARCTGGLSKVAVGSLCEVCQQRPSKPAYEKDELVARFETVRESRETAWYIDEVDERVNLTALAWKATPELISFEKYGNSPEMLTWLKDQLPESDIMWLDEVFADKTVKPKGNLVNFGGFVRGLAAQLGVGTVAYRTIEPRMLAVANRDFGDATTIYAKETNVPDWRDFVVIELSREETQ